MVTIYLLSIYHVYRGSTVNMKYDLCSNVNFSITQYCSQVYRCVQDLFHVT